MSRQTQSKTILDVLHKNFCELFERDNQVDVTFFPNADDSDIKSEIDSNDDDDTEENVANSSEVQNILLYKKVYEHYTSNQKVLEGNHKYYWVLGEKMREYFMKKVIIM